MIRKIGNSEGVIIPKEALDQFGLASGDKLEVVATRDGIKLVRSDSDFAMRMREAKKFMDKYHEALWQPAK